MAKPTPMLDQIADTIAKADGGDPRADAGEWGTSTVEQVSPLQVVLEKS